MRFSTLGVFHQSTPPRALIHWLKPFRIWLRIRRDNRFERRPNLFQRGQWPRWNRKWSLKFPHFCLKYIIVYGMCIFLYETVLRDIPFLKKLWAQNEELKFHQGHIYFSGVNDPAEIDQELRNCLLKGTVCMFFLPPIFSSVSHHKDINGL
jgi:hypothetical protein